MTFKKRMAFGGLVFLILYVIILGWLLRPVYVEGAQLHADKFVKLACDPNDEEEDVDGYRIYWRTSKQGWNQERSVKFYRWKKVGDPKIIWTQNSDTKKVIIGFQLTPALASLETNTHYQFYATAFKGDDESDPSSEKPYWLSPALLQFEELKINDLDNK